MEPLSVTRDREIALLDKAIETFKRDAGLLAKVRDLREQSEAAYKARQIVKAIELRHSALIQIGYKVETPAADSGISTNGAVPAPAKALSPGNLPQARGCSGGSTDWVAPAQ